MLWCARSATCNTVIRECTWCPPPPRTPRTSLRPSGLPPPHQWIRCCSPMLSATMRLTKASSPPGYTISCGVPATVEAMP